MVKSKADPAVNQLRLREINKILQDEMGKDLAEKDLWEIGNEWFYIDRKVDNNGLLQVRRGNGAFSAGNRQNNINAGTRDRLDFGRFLHLLQQNQGSINLIN